jgi:hypothetical protein
MHVHVCMYVYKRYLLCVREKYCRHVCAIDLTACIPSSGMGVCMYVRMYVCMYVCMYACLGMYVYIY